ncbi:MAG TPA: LmeA family phospholipid-binding protein [Solirubrobacteraceae bacterium]|jgi:hypothetical protein|nr:LmeA family phospholipid-binding protein [Solirubrobacteraceae bacterium]
MSHRRSVRVGVGAVGGLVVLLGLAQLLLPRLAAHVVRSELARYGTVHSVSVSAFPAIELAWGHAQSASISMGDVRMSQEQANTLLGKARGVQRIDVHADSLRVGSLTLDDVDWRKRGDSTHIDGLLGESDMRTLLPGSSGFELLASKEGTATMRVKGNLFGVSTALNVQLSAVEGKLVAQPQNSLFGGLVKVTLLSESHLDVRSIALAAAPSADAADPTYRVSVTAQLR